MRRESGQLLIEWAVTLPLLLIILVGLVDVAQLVLLQSRLDNLTREAANLASRGMTLEETWGVLLYQDDPLDLASDGQVIISLIARRSTTDDTPVIQQQQVFGGRRWIASRIGSPGDPARIPGDCTSRCITSLPNGIVMVAVESAYSYGPIIPAPRILMPFGNFVYEIAYF